ncbi:hypothetical protein I546_6996 [Mycobacterium kansasii 732]|nr:hypothetical protein I546_6996 [Mycobacterium kansasii 732]
MTSTWTPPNRSSAARTAEVTWSDLVTSRATASTRSGVASASSATVLTSRAVTTTLWPVSIAASASARPSPLEQPVISHVDIEKCLLSVETTLAPRGQTAGGGLVLGRCRAPRRRASRLAQDRQ